MTGMDEVVQDSGGSAPLSSLASSLQFDIEDLLACVDALELLGFAMATSGELRLTPEGAAFAEASIEEKKDLLARALLAPVPNVTMLVARLRVSAGHPPSNAARLGT